MRWLLLWFCLAQTTYYGPKSPYGPTPSVLPGGVRPVRVEVLVYDQGASKNHPNGLQIESVTFNGQVMALKPSGVYSFRGGGSFQVVPGRYTLSWVVQRDPVNWPRTLSFTKKIDIDSSSYWVQITIHGDQMEID